MSVGEIISIALSVGTALVTVYFWLVRANRERPNLKTHLVAPFDTFFDSSARAYRLRNFEKWPFKGTPWDQPDHNCFFYYIMARAVVANLSLEPNTVTGVRAFIKARDGSWQPLHTAFLACPPDAAPPIDFDSQSHITSGEGRLPDIVPFNVSPQNGAFLRLVCWLTIPEGESWFEKKRLPSSDFHTHLRQFVLASLAQPLELKLDVSALGDKVFSDVLSMPATDGPPPRLRLAVPPTAPLPNLPVVPASAASEILASVKDFVQRTAEPDGSFRPRLAQGSSGDYDSADSPLAAVAYAAVLARTFGWQLPHAAQTREWLASRQHPDGMFGLAPYVAKAAGAPAGLQTGSRAHVRWRGGETEYPGTITQREGERIHVQYDDGATEWTTVDLARPEGSETPLPLRAKVLHTALGLMALHALNAEPRHDPLPFFREVLAGSLEHLPEYFASVFPLAFQMRGQSLPVESDRKVQEFMTAKMFSNPYLQDSHLEGMCQAVHYHRLQREEMAEAVRVLKHIQQGFRVEESNGGWWNNSRGRARGMYSGVFILRHLGKRQGNSERIIAEAAGMLLADRSKPQGESRFWEIHDPTADSVFFCTTALVVAGVLRPVEVPNAHLLGWGHLMS